MQSLLSILVMLVCAGGLAQGCGPSDPATARRDEIVEILELHLEHQDAILGILERRQDDPRAAAEELDAYLAEHGEAIDELCDKRRLLEADPNALAAAMRMLEPEMSRTFQRRLALSKQAPELMAREEVQTALAALDRL